MKNQPDIKQIKSEIIQALQHPEAEEGLYLDNFYHLHEEDTRPMVNATESQIVGALEQLISEGAVHIDSSSGKVVFKITASQAM